VYAKSTGTDIGRVTFRVGFQNDDPETKKPTGWLKVYKFDIEPKFQGPRVAQCLLEQSLLAMNEFVGVDNFFSRGISFDWDPRTIAAPRATCLALTLSMKAKGMNQVRIQPNKAYPEHAICPIDSYGLIGSLCDVQGTMRDDTSIDSHINLQLKGTWYFPTTTHHAAEAIKTDDGNFTFQEDNLAINVCRSQNPASWTPVEPNFLPLAEGQLGASHLLKMGGVATCRLSGHRVVANLCDADRQKNR
jgi:hypothetical protein